MSTIKGQNLRLFLDNEVVAGARTCTVSVQMETESLDVKDITGDWDEKVPTGMSFSIQSDNVIWRNSDWGRNTSDVLAMVGSKVTVRLAQASGQHNAIMGPTILVGDAFISDISLTAENKRLGTYSFTLTGASELRSLVADLQDANGVDLLSHDNQQLQAAL